MLYQISLLDESQMTSTEYKNIFKETVDKAYFKKNIKYIYKNDLKI